MLLFICLQVVPPSHQELGYTALLEIASEMRAAGWVLRVPRMQGGDRVVAGDTGTPSEHGTFHNGTCTLYDKFAMINYLSHTRTMEAVPCTSSFYHPLVRLHCRHTPIVVLSDELVRAPEAVLRALCLALNLPFDPAMMSWPAGEAQHCIYAT